MQKTYFLLIFWGLSIPFSFAQSLVCTAENQALCEQLLTELQQPAWKSRPMGEVATAIGKRLQRTPYVAHTLETEGGREPLVVNLAALDCTTFLENAVVFSRLQQMQRFGFEDFTRELTHIRYRGGVRGEYPSRLHYFSEWLADNAQKGVVADLTLTLGGVPYDKKLTFMSTHRSSYPALQNDAFYAEIQAQEQALNRQVRHFIPQDDIARVESQLKEGDLVALTTSIKGLDVVHVGLVTRKNGRVHLLHASSEQKQVVVSDEPLADYVKRNKNQNGIMVARLLPVE